MTLEQFIKSCKISHIHGYVKDGHLILIRERGMIPVEIEKELPKHEAELMKRYPFPKYQEEGKQSPYPPVDKKREQAKQILFKALNDINLLDDITERACTRWADGYSDSLLNAVLCNMGVSTDERGEELKPKTNWLEEIRKIFGTDVKLSDGVIKMLKGVI